MYNNVNYVSSYEFLLKHIHTYTSSLLTLIKVTRGYQLMNFTILEHSFENDVFLLQKYITCNVIYHTPGTQNWELRDSDWI